MILLTLKWRSFYVNRSLLRSFEPYTKRMIEKSKTNLCRHHFDIIFACFFIFFFFSVLISFQMNTKMFVFTNFTLTCASPDFFFFKLKKWKSKNTKTNAKEKMGKEIITKKINWGENEITNCSPQQSAVNWTQAKHLLTHEIRCGRLLPMRSNEWRVT